MGANNYAIELIKQFEGLVLNAYLDPIGIWTIGYGHTEGVKKGQVITESQAEEYLDEDLTDFIHQIQVSLGDTYDKLNEFQLGAIISFVYNVGIGNFNNSTLRKKLMSGDYAGAAMEFAKWNKAGGRVLPGLVRRRSAETVMFERTQ